MVKQGHRNEFASSAQLQQKLIQLDQPNANLFRILNADVSSKLFMKDPLEVANRIA